MHKTSINNSISSQIETLVSVSLFNCKLTLNGFGIQGGSPFLKFHPDFVEDPCVWNFYIFFCLLDSFKGIIELANFLQSTKSHKVTHVKTKPDKNIAGVERIQFLCLAKRCFSANWKIRKGNLYNACILFSCHLCTVH